MDLCNLAGMDNKTADEIPGSSVHLQESTEKLRPERRKKKKFKVPGEEGDEENQQES